MFSERLARGAGHRTGIVGILMCAVSCTTATGMLPRIMLAPPEAGHKLLRPRASARGCEGGFFPGYGSGAPDLLTTTTTALLKQDEEADAILDARIEWSSWSVGVYARRCVRVEGDLVRGVRTILLPMGRHHGSHAP